MLQRELSTLVHEKHDVGMVESSLLVLYDADISDKTSETTSVF